MMLSEIGHCDALQKPSTIWGGITYIKTREA